MSNDPIVIPFRRATPPGILATEPLPRTQAVEAATRRPTRYVTQSHRVSAPMTNPTAIVFAVVIAIGLFVLGRRLSS